jgi:predicted dithiol-disulfide oxidoreductase (DUF899 family)
MSVTEASATHLHDRRFPGESAAYRRARDELLEAERELRRQIERVAAQRRALPPGGRAREDYVFDEGEPARPVKLSELFGDKDDLLLYSYMYGPDAAEPCPYCTSMLDGLDGQIPHINQQAAVAVAARSPIGRIRAFAAARGWRNLRLISSAGNSYSQDYFGEEANGAQRPILNVFTRRGGEIRHAWATELAFVAPEPGQSPRHVDMIWPLWNALDMTPGGRGDFDLKLSY